MRQAHISFETFEVLQRLRKNFIVVFSSSWSRKNRPSSAAFDSLSHDTVVLEVNVDASSAAEDYCVDTLRSQSLPVACVFFSGTLWKSYEFEEINDLPMNINGFVALFSESQLMSFELDKSIDVVSALFPADRRVMDEPVYIFISGDRSSVGKSTTCLALLASLVSKGIDPSMLAYIKPVTQCEATQPVVTYCERVGITHQGIGPVVFYKGFTRAYLAGETDSSEQLIQSAVQSVKTIGRGKQFVLVDGVGYPGVGSICNISNADVARALEVPVLLVGKEGVGDAVDSFNMNAAFFEIKGVTVLGGVFNKLPLTGFYSLEACQAAVSSYFRQFKPAQLPYGFVPVISTAQSEGAMDVVKPFEELLSESFLRYVDVTRLLFDTWKFNKIVKNLHETEPDSVRPPNAVAAVSLSRLPPPPAPVSVARQSTVASTVRTLTSPLIQKPVTHQRIPVTSGIKVIGAINNSSVVSKPMDVSEVKVSLKRSREEVERDAAAQGAKGG